MRYKLYIWLAVLMLGLLSSAVMPIRVAYADDCVIAPQSDFCEGSYRLVGTISPVSGRTTSQGPNPDPQGVAYDQAIESPLLPSAGQLIYVDFKQIETEARTKLERGLTMRESISPYKQENDFNTHLRNLDYAAGWDQVYPGTTPYEDTLTFIQVVNSVEKDLTEARDLYAFLVVFAPEARFRNDGDYNSSLCGITDKEDPNPADPAFSGQVLDPVIDWCNFRARLRQSVREAANVRMILGQEFMVDALVRNFSSDFQGVDDFVKEEVARLRAAHHQYEKAEQFLTGGLKRVIGNGCSVSDFYTQTEWSLLSRAIELQGTTQYHIATRLSYLDISSPQSVPQAQAVAQKTFRRSANDGYIKLIGLVGMAGNQPIAERSHCEIGEHPQGDLVAEMALNLLETKRQSSEMAAGRNIFGFDVTFTPARPYKSSTARGCDTNAVGNRGLWDEAKCSADLAAKLQARLETEARTFDASQKELRDAIEKIRGGAGGVDGLDDRIYNVTGCDRDAVSTDEEWYSCVDMQTDLIESCLNVVHLDAATFDACMDPSVLATGTNARSALNDLRGIYLDYQVIYKSAQNINERIKVSNYTEATVSNWLLASGTVESVARVAQVAFDTVDCIDFTDNALSFGAQGGACVSAGVLNGAIQGYAGAISTAADVNISAAENKKEIENLLLDMSELVIAAQSAQQAFFSKKTDLQGMLDVLNRDVRETKRQRAYFASSPANDPSFRIVRDSARLELADALEKATRIAYLAARRAEYEFAARLSASNFRISDIYRARTAQDILRYLDKLQQTTGNLTGGTTAEVTPIDLKVSVAQHVLQLTDEFLRGEGFTTAEAISAERTRRFRKWVAENTVINDFEAPRDNKPVLKFSLTTSLLDGGLFSNVIPQGYDRQWRLQLSGVGSPKASSNGVSINLVSAANDLSYRKVAITQGGLVHLRSNAGCIFDYRLIAPAALLGLEFAKNQDPEVATDLFNANVNNEHPYTENNYRTPRFEGRAISATDWEIVVFAGAPETTGLPDMDLQQLNDIELNLSAVYSGRQPGQPELSECTRIDY